MTTSINVPNDWQDEVEGAVRIALAESSPWNLMKPQRDEIRRAIMRRLANVLPLGGGGVKQPTGGGGPKQPV